MKTVMARLVLLANKMDEAGLATEASFIDKTLQFMGKKPKQQVDLQKLNTNDIFNDPNMLDDDIADQDPNYVPGQKTVWDELEPSQEDQLAAAAG